MRIERIKNLNAEMQAIQPDNIGYKIMKDKTQVLGFKICALKIQAIQILKQDALSLGAELVTPRNTILAQEKYYDCLLFGTPKSLKLLASKMQQQPFGLKTLGKDLKQFIKPKTTNNTMSFLSKTKLMSIINIDSKSFYQEYKAQEGIEKIYEHIAMGADIIDIGAVSTRPYAEIIPAEIELQRLQAIFKEVRNIKTNTLFSIDTYNKEVAQAALDSGFSMINDVSGKPENMLEVLSHNPQASYILTHTRGTPQTMQNLCDYKNLLLEIDNFFEEKIKILYRAHCNTIILDVGIGFAKNCLQNIALISKLAHFKHFHKPLLIGASHKSFLQTITNSGNKERLEETLLTHFLALQNGANILRVHDLKAHQNMLKIFDAFAVNDCDIL